MKNDNSTLPQLNHIYSYLDSLQWISQCTTMMCFIKKIPNRVAHTPVRNQ